MKKFITSLFCAALLPLAALEISVAQNKYRCKKGEKVTFLIQLDKGRENGDFQVLLQGGSYLAYVQKMSADANGRAHLTLNADRAGFLSVRVDDAGKSAAAAVAVDELKILPARERPDTFDRRWNRVRKALDISPVQYEIKEIVSQRENFRAFEVIVAMPEKDSPQLYAVMTMPSNAPAGRLAAHIFYGDRNVDSASAAYKENTLALSVDLQPLARGGRKVEVLPQVGKNFLKDLKKIDDLAGNIVPDIFKRAARAVQFVKTLPEWDNRTVIVSGIGLGGAQAIAAAALDEDVTLCVALSPAFGNHGGFDKGSESGWPRFHTAAGYQRDPERALKLLDDIDSCFFAQNIRRAEVIVYCGFLDDDCAPSSVYAIYNMVSSTEKQLYASFNGGHLPPAEVTEKIDHQIKAHIDRKQAAFR